VTLGVMCAIPQELDHLLGALADGETQLVAGARFHTGILGGHRVVLADTGMGKVNAALVATLLADRYHCGAIVFTGVAGGLDPALGIGDVVIADHVLQHDAGLVEEDRFVTYQAGHVAFINPTDRFGHPTHPGLLTAVQTRLDEFRLPVPAGRDTPPRIVYGRVLTGDQYLNSESTRERLYADFDGKAVEMEGGAVAQVCEAFGIPWLVIRALSDLAGADSQFDFLTFVTEVAANSAAILLHLLPTLDEYLRTG
jgi:adenosylhomocysteine nucleosidase